MKNILTVDLEDWFHSISSIPVEDWTKYERRVNVGSESLLGLFEEYAVSATFFVLGAVAEDFPELIRRISDAGHEIASHGYAHRLVYEQSEDEFRKDVAQSLEILSPLSNDGIRGYRAPWWSVTKRSLWALPVLAELGFKYDSSIYPANAGYYGIAGAPEQIHYREVDEGHSLWEVPPLIRRFFGQPMPAGGGFSLRTFPHWFHRGAICDANRRGRPALVYLHPWELDTDQPNIPLPLDQKLIHYTRLNRMRGALVRLLENFEFGPIRESLPSV
ncbi:MAG: DUF3473 domain-containing protein [Planctomycetota bacterium]|nr:DUF3473 domain-containing protein [Planctomycetota bacterium]